MPNSEPKFYACEKCHVIIEEICGGKEQFSCDGVGLTELKANSTDASQEKHVPVVTKEGNRITVSVGSVIHPMSEEHSIEWIYLQTKHGSQRVNLSPVGKPEAIFLLPENDAPVAVYAYCNLHGFWKTDLD